MRVSSLSDERVIRRLSRYFVPAWVSRDHYQMAAPPRGEVELMAKLDAGRRAKKFEGGSVCAFAARADGTVLGTLPVGKASNPDLLTAFLDRVIAAEKLAPRDAEAVAPPARPRPAAKDGRLFTVRSRFDDKGTNRGTSRDLVELTREEWGAFLPPDGARLGQRWTVAAATSEKLLRYAYPPLPHWEAKKGKLTACELRAELVAAGRQQTVALRGRVALVYPDLGKPTDGKLTAQVVGFATAEAGALTSLTLASEEGRYVWHWEGKPITRPTSFAVELEP
jgi:hypothetical protein